MIKYTLPDFTVGLSRNMFFIQLWQDHPEYFIDDLQIDSVYGCFPSCVLNGGRSFIRDRYTTDQIDRTFALLADHSITARLTFTNMLAKPEHLNDPYVVEILEAAKRYKGEVIVYSDELAQAVRDRYGLKCVLSTTRAIKDIKTFNEKLEQYEYVVLDYNCNKDREFLSQIEKPEKVEVMVNEFCRYECPHREQHYLHNSADQMENVMRPFACPHEEDRSFFEHSSDHPVFLTDKEVQELNKTFGIGYFKIVGRGIPFETVLESYVYYLAKPEYREAIKQAVHLSMQK